MHPFEHLRGEGQGVAAGDGVVLAVIRGNPNLLEKLGIDGGAVGLHGIRVLPSRCATLRNAVDKHLIFDDLQRIARHGYAALDVVFTLIHGAIYNCEAVVKLFAPHLPREVVVVSLGELRDDRVAHREVEYHHVAPLHPPKAGAAVVVTLDPAYVRWGMVREGKRVVREGQGEGGIG